MFAQAPWHYQPPRVSTSTSSSSSSSARLPVQANYRGSFIYFVFTRRVCGFCREEMLNCRKCPRRCTRIQEHFLVGASLRIFAGADAFRARKFRTASRDARSFISMRVIKSYFVFFFFFNVILCNCKRRRNIRVIPYIEHTITGQVKIYIRALDARIWMVEKFSRKNAARFRRERNGNIAWRCVSPR